MSCEKDHSLVVGKIKEASSLATTQFTVDKLVYGVKKKNLFWVVDLSESRFLAQSQAIIKAGIDLNDIQEDDVKISGNRIALKLPAVKVITFSYPAHKFKEYKNMSDDYVLNRISVKEKEKFYRDAEIDIRNSLKYLDIEKSTQTNTRAMMEALLKNLGYTEIFIAFEKGLIVSEVPEDIIQ